MRHLEHSSAWQSLIKHQKSLSSAKISQFFAMDPERVAYFSLKDCGIYLDYSKNQLTEKTIDLLINLALEAQLPAKINALFSGEKINQSENRPALHTLLRDQSTKSFFIDGEDYMSQIIQSRQKMFDFCEKVQHAPFTDVVNVGIGGSDLGPRMAIEALYPYRINKLNFHFISNLDGINLEKTLKKLNPTTTLVVVSSKSFSTNETILNTQVIRQWFASSGHEEIFQQNSIAITANTKAALATGFTAQQIFPLWDWVGGRYSLWSSIGLTLCLAIGKENFNALLVGAFAMDQHFRQQPLRANMPVLLALISIWYRNFFGAETHAVIPYSQQLQFFPDYLQQLAMESNGKSVSQEGERINYATNPITWGKMGCDGQHAFHQLLHQGTSLIPIDFILPLQIDSIYKDHQKHLVANCLSQAKALMLGKDEATVINELKSIGLDEKEIKQRAPHLIIKGNQPSNTLILEKITPFSLGALIALYEHKTFTQGVLWNINSFDQWGVELGKTLANQILQELDNNADLSHHDSSTQFLIEYYRQQQGIN